MTLSFSQKFKDKSPNYFPWKIWAGLLTDKIATHDQHVYFLRECREKLNKMWDDGGKSDIKFAKIHTIRADPKNRWREGMCIHFVINNRTKNRFQFAPILPVKKVQRIVIQWKECELDGTKQPFCWIDGNCLCAGFDATNWRLLARNDGFESTDDFFRWFSSDFTGKLIHWTDFSY